VAVCRFWQCIFALKILNILAVSTGNLLLMFQRSMLPLTYSSLFISFCSITFLKTWIVINAVVGAQNLTLVIGAGNMRNIGSPFVDKGKLRDFLKDLLFKKLGS